MKDVIILMQLKKISQRNKQHWKHQDVYHAKTQDVNKVVLLILIFLLSFRYPFISVFADKALHISDNTL